MLINNYGNMIFLKYFVFFSATLSSSCKDGSVRLINGTSSNDGQIEVCVNGIWGGVCDDNWSQVEANLVCNQLGHTCEGKYTSSDLECIHYILYTSICLKYVHYYICL